MYLKDSKTTFFSDWLDFVGLEAGTNELRPSVRKQNTILKWSTQSTQEEVEAFCYLTPFLQQVIPGRTELVWIIKYKAESSQRKELISNKRKKRLVEKGFTWTEERNIAFEVVKQAIANNVMAAPDPQAQYHLTVDASKDRIGGFVPSRGNRG